MPRRRLIIAIAAAAVLLVAAFLRGRGYSQSPPLNADEYDWPGQDSAFFKRVCRPVGPRFGTRTASGGSLSGRATSTRWSLPTCSAVGSSGGLRTGSNSTGLQPLYLQAMSAARSVAHVVALVSLTAGVAGCGDAVGYHQAAVGPAHTQVLPD